MSFSHLQIYEDSIFQLIKENFFLNCKKEYKLVGIVSCPCYNHYNTIIFKNVKYNMASTKPKKEKKTTT